MQIFPMYKEIQSYNSENIKGYSFEQKIKQLTIWDVKMILKLNFTLNDIKH